MIAPWVWIVSGLISALILWLVIRFAVLGALKAHTLWQREGGVEKAEQRRAAQRVPVPEVKTRALNSSPAWWDKEQPPKV